jgi:hypothetical protein
MMFPEMISTLLKELKRVIFYSINYELFKIYCWKKFNYSFMRSFSQVTIKKQVSVPLLRLPYQMRL